MIFMMNVRGSGFLRKFRARRKLHSPFCGSHNPLKSWRNSPRHSQITWPIGLGGDSSVTVLKSSKKKHGKFTVAKVHNKRSRDACHVDAVKKALLDLQQTHTKTCKDAWAWYKGQESVSGGHAGKLVQSSHVTRGKGWGKEKRSERLKVAFFSLTSFSSVNGTI